MPSSELEQSLPKGLNSSRAVVAHTFNPSNWEAEAGRSLRVRGQPGLQRVFQDNQGNTEKPCLEKREGLNI